jgi:hypothetical protein
MGGVPKGPTNTVLEMFSKTDENFFLSQKFIIIDGIKPSGKNIKLAKVYREQWLRKKYISPSSPL